MIKIIHEYQCDECEKTAKVNITELGKVSKWIIVNYFDKEKPIVKHFCSEECLRSHFDEGDFEGD